jgi:hypothetical protein
VAPLSAAPALASVSVSVSEFIGAITIPRVQVEQRECESAGVVTWDTICVSEAVFLYTVQYKYIQ